MTIEVRNILKTFRRATADDIAGGVEWYARAERAAAIIAASYGLPTNTVVGVMAALSPNNRWTRNVKDAETMCKAWASGDNLDGFRVCCYNTMKAKAWSILAEELTDDEDILARLNGLKIRSFYSNIRGLDEVTIDGHALNIARGKRKALTDNSTNMGKRLYREMQSHYIRAAKRAGVEPHVMQAVTWITWRREHGI